MRRSPLIGTLVLGAVVLTGCADETPTAPVDAAAPLQSVEAVASVADAASSPDYLVVFKKGAIPAGFDARVAELGGEVRTRIQVAGAAVVTGLSPEGLDVLRGDRGVDVVEPEAILDLPRPAEIGEPVMALSDAMPASPTDPAGAFFFPRQWNMRAIGADVAWAAGNTGSSDVTVAILDTGIGYTHPDLIGRVDLDRSISFLTLDDAYVAFYFPGAHPVADIGYHGTHVAATVASNGWAAAGVTSQTTLMGVKVCSGLANRGCPGGAIFAGIEHAVDNGADVINMSLGGAFLRRGSRGYISVLNRLFNYARMNGVTVVVSAGNDAADLDRNYYPNADDVQTHYPSLYKTYCTTPGNICVSSTGPTAGGRLGPWTDVDAPAVYTNYGRSAVNVAAPGGNTGAAVTAACSPFSLRIPVCQTGSYVLGISGTSMAAPHVSGLAALMVAEHGRSPAKVRAAMERAADDLGQPGTDPFYGKGRINVATATGSN